MKQIIAMGGGGFTDEQSNLKIEHYLVKQTKKKNPKVCFLPQASAESQEYIVKFYQTFSNLEAKASWISLFGNVKSGWEEHLLKQDLIYVGGGNTRSMLALWREWGMVEVLLEAYEKGIILSGISAGAICWFEQGITNSVWPLGVLDCLGVIPGSCCPHYDIEPERKPTYLKKVKNKEIIPGIALNNNIAAHYIDGQLKYVLTELDGRKAFRVSLLSEEELEISQL